LKRDAPGALNADERAELVRLRKELAEAKRSIDQYFPDDCGAHRQCLASVLGATEAEGVSSLCDGHRFKIASMVDGHTRKSLLDNRHES
jgi:hypothetical protein